MKKLYTTVRPDLSMLSSIGYTGRIEAYGWDEYQIDEKEQVEYDDWSFIDHYLNGLVHVPDLDHIFERNIEKIYKERKDEGNTR